VRLVEVDGVFFNPELVSLVERADPNEEGFLTEVHHDGKSRLVRLELRQVVTLLTS
jgi:hypothetical protein